MAPPHRATRTILLDGLAVRDDAAASHHDAHMKPFAILRRPDRLSRVWLEHEDGRPCIRERPGAGDAALDGAFARLSSFDPAREDDREALARVWTETLYDEALAAHLAIPLCTHDEYRVASVLSKVMWDDGIWEELQQPSADSRSR